MPTIVVYSDQPILAMGMKGLIASEPALELRACCASMGALREHLTNESPDLALLDLTHEIWREGLAELQKLAPACKVVLWTDAVGAEFAFEALTAGVRGVLRKTLPLAANLQCLRRVLAGGLWFEKRLTESLRTSRRVKLSRRESQLVTLLSRGLKNKEIAQELGISEGTVKVYLSRLFRKVGSKGRYDLALCGLKNLGAAGVARDRNGGLRSLVMEPPCAA